MFYEAVRVYWENRQLNLGKDAFKRSPTSVEVCDSSEGTNSRADASPVAVSPVLSGPQVVHSALVVWLVVQQPVAIHHITGVEVRHAEVVLDIWAVVHQLVHLAGHVGAFVKPHLEGASVLAEDGRVCYYVQYNNISHWYPLLTYNLVKNWSIRAIFTAPLNKISKSL